MTTPPLTPAQVETLRRLIFERLVFERLASRIGDERQKFLASDLAHYLAPTVVTIAAEHAAARVEELRARVEAVQALIGNPNELWLDKRGGKLHRFTRRDRRLGCDVTETYVLLSDLEDALTPTPTDSACPTPGCDGDPRYAAPGRRHKPGCTYPLPTNIATGDTEKEEGQL